MLKDSLYIIKQNSVTATAVEALVELNEQHEIFKGHFPLKPVLPGACMLQMIKEILSLSLAKKLQLSTATEIKFLQMIEPGGEMLQIFIEYKYEENASININAKILKNDVVCCKMKALFVVIQ